MGKRTDKSEIGNEERDEMGGGHKRRTTARKHKFGVLYQTIKQCICHSIKCMSLYNFVEYTIIMTFKKRTSG